MAPNVIVLGRFRKTKDAQRYLTTALAAITPAIAFPLLATLFLVDARAAQALAIASAPIICFLNDAFNTACARDAMTDRRGHGIWNARETYAAS
jgi:hypothetical protein